jgi:hypothetical protein
MNTWSISTCADELRGFAKNVAAISDLVSRVSSALKAVESLTPLWEISEKYPSAGRSVIQFRVTPELFDLFFNSSAGYRAMFRRGPRIGGATNAALVASINELLSHALPEPVAAQLIEFGPKWKGQIGVQKADFLRSLDPSLAKVWYCTAEVESSGRIRVMPTGVSDAKIDIGLVHEWVEIRQTRGDCMLEAKGAFVGPYGLFQPKDPELRARTLFSKGEA